MSPSQALLLGDYVPSLQLQGYPMASLGGASLAMHSLAQSLPTVSCTLHNNMRA